MFLTRPRSVIACALTLLATALPAVAQGVFGPGQMAEPGLSLWASNHIHPKMDPLRANEEFDLIGLRRSVGSAQPAQTMELFYGKVALELRPGNLATFGVRFVPIYSDSPTETFENFGDGFAVPTLLNPAFNPKDAKDQWQHMPPRSMYYFFPTYDPTSPTDWVAGGFPTGAPGAPSAPIPVIGNVSGSGFIPTVAFTTVERVADPAPTSPTGGRLIGINAILQGTVLDTNATMPPTPQLRLTNAIGLRCMAGPPIKIGVDGGNYGGRGSFIRLKGEYITPTLRAFIPGPGGALNRLVTRHIDGETFEVGVGPETTTGVMQFASEIAQGSTDEDPILVVTHGPVLDAAIDSVPPIHVEMEDGQPVFGFSVIGTADQLGEIIDLLPPNALALFDLDIEIYPYDDVDNLAGYGAAVGVSVDVTSTGGGSTNGAPAPLGIMGQTVALAEVPVAPILVSNLGTSGAVASVSYEDLSGDYALSFNSTAPMSNVRYLAVVRARSAN